MLIYSIKYKGIFIILPYNFTYLAYSIHTKILHFYKNVIFSTNLIKTNLKFAYLQLLVYLLIYYNYIFHIIFSFFCIFFNAHPSPIIIKRFKAVGGSHKAPSIHPTIAHIKIDNRIAFSSSLFLSK